MNAGKITAGIIVALAAVAFFSIFIVKEVIKLLFFNLVIQKE